MCLDSPFKVLTIKHLLTLSCFVVFFWRRERVGLVVHQILELLLS